MRLAIVAAAALLAGCDGRPSRACSPAVAAARCHAGVDPFACGWLRAVDAPDDEAAWRALLPALEGKTIVDGPLPAPSVTLAWRNYRPFELTVPADWSADPYRSRSWTLELQGLRWLRTADLDDAAAVLVDWAERAMPRDPPLTWTWDEHAMANRIDFVTAFFEKYAREHEQLDRRVVRAVARIVDSHLHALSTEVCYAGRDNHGMIQDTAVLMNLRHYPRLADAGRIRATVERRMRDHVARSVTADGLHVENSPEYQVLYLQRVVDAIDAIDPPPADLVAVRDRMFAAIRHMLQPNLTFPQFGDTENARFDRMLGQQIAKARAQGGGDPAILDELARVLAGDPGQLDRVFVDGGYAAFGDATVAGHFKASRLSKAHYHKDETTFELYGYGTELVVDAGKYDYEHGRPIARYQRDVFAHSVLVVDDTTTSPRTARIVAHGDRWVQGMHDGYRGRGVTSLVRTFAHPRDDTFAVIDHVRAGGRHRYAQRFLLAPALSDVEIVDERTVVARAPGGPTLVITAAAPASIDLVDAWSFPAWRTATRTTFVVFRHEAADATLPVLFTIAAPGAPPIIPRDLTLTSDATTTVLAWTTGEHAHSIDVPTP